MKYKLHKNGVITGSLNSFCLACEIFLNSKQEATDHIGTSEHKKKSNAVQYSDKFKDEHIKKFKGGYYCEFCNVLMPIASKVNLHITENEHKQNKGILLLKPMGGDVVAYNNILIEEKAWHGLIDEVCSLCNAEFEDENDHKTDASHSLNLVLKPIQFGADSAIYRHLDDTAAQCLTCNKLLAPGRMTKHFDDTEHQELYAKRLIETNEDCQGIEAKENCQAVEAKENCQGVEAKENCQETATNITSVIENDDEIKKSKIDNDANKNNNEKSQTKDKSKILESIAKYQTKGININLETETAFCKKCSKVITFDFMEIENHMENHSSAAAVDSDLQYPSNLDQNLNRVDINDKSTQSSDDKQNTEVLNDNIKALPDKDQNNSSSDSDSDGDTGSTMSVSEWHDTQKENFEKCNQEEDAREFAKANKINYGGDKNQSYCRTCEVHLPASFRSMKEHVEGANHKRLTPSTITQPKISGRQAKQSTAEFLDSAYDVHGYFYTASVINEKYCILSMSLYLIMENDSRRRCIVCEVNLSPSSDIIDHVRTSQHLDKWTDVPVIISERKEFIREVRPGLYHCGYCHLAVSGWANMKHHLECSDHRDNRSLGESRMRQHMPDLQRFKMRKQQTEAITLMRFLNMFN